MNPISRSGKLQDYIHRPGDGNPDDFKKRGNSSRQLWGSRAFISNFIADNNLGAPKTRTLVETPTFDEPTPINVQLRFAAATPGPNPQPILPFLYTQPGAMTRVITSVRRGIDEQASPTMDTYNTAPGDVLPFDIVTAKQLGIDCTASSFAPGGNFDDTRGFVEMIATPVCVVGPKNNSYPYDVAANPSFKTTAATPFALLTPNPQRIQFFVVNTSTDADLLLQFGVGPNGNLPTWAPNPNGTLVLPRGGFAVYESPTPMCFKGTVWGIWSNVGNGGAMLYEGNVY